MYRHDVGPPIPMGFGGLVLRLAWGSVGALVTLYFGAALAGVVLYDREAWTALMPLAGLLAGLLLVAVAVRWHDPRMRTAARHAFVAAIGLATLEAMVAVIALTWIVGGVAPQFLAAVVVVPIGFCLGLAGGAVIGWRRANRRVR